MPKSAIDRVGVDYVRGAAQIGPLIGELVKREEAHATKPTPDETDVVEGHTSALRVVPGVDPSSPFICPDCGGALWQINDGRMLRLRCHVGHGYTAETLYRRQEEQVEQSLWAAVRVLEEQAELQQRMAGTSPADLGRRFLDNARERWEMADVIRTLITGQGNGNSGERGDQLQREYGSAGRAS
jgi:two-component system chemotaxis response regulator CheB